MGRWGDTETRRQWDAESLFDQQLSRVKPSFSLPPAPCPLPIYSLFPVPCSLPPAYLFPVPCSLFPVPCSLFPVPCPLPIYSLFPVPCSLFPVPCSLPPAYLFPVPCSLFTNYELRIIVKTLPLAASRFLGLPAWENGLYSESKPTQLSHLVLPLFYPIQLE